MYAEAELELPSFSHGFLQEVAVGSYHGHYSHLPLPDDGFISGFHVGAAGGGLSMGNMVQTCAVSEYDMGGEGDLFKAPEPILEVPSLELDPVTAAIISVGGDVITETIKVADIESIQTDHLNDIFYECKKDLLEESEIEDSISELLDVKIPAVQMDEVPLSEKLSYAEGSMQKSVSSGCLSSVEWIPGGTRRPDFLDFQGLDFEAAILGLRRAYSEGDIQNLGKNNTSIGNTTAVCSSFEQLLTISDVKTER